jgi:iron(III) transport system permease protein
VRIFEIALALPLAFPAYVLAYAYTHFLDHPGAVQTLLRDVTGWGPRDYWFPEIRSLPGAAAMLTFVLYPYVYLLARAAFLQQSATAFLAARALGRSAWGAFWSVSLPMARPAIAGGVLLAIMETIADLRHGRLFRRADLRHGHLHELVLARRPGGGGAARALPSGLRAPSRPARAHAARRRAAPCRGRPVRADATAGSRLEGAGAILLCGSRCIAASRCRSSFSRDGDRVGPGPPVAALPALHPELGDARLDRGARHRLRRRRDRLHPAAPEVAATEAAAQIARIGYAVPGGVIAVGLLVPFAAFDNTVDAWMRANLGISTGLLFTGSIWLLVGAYVVRFMAAALSAYDGGQAAIHTNMDAVARTLGHTPAGMLGGCTCRSCGPRS